MHLPSGQGTRTPTTPMAVLLTWTRTCLRILVPLRIGPRDGSALHDEVLFCSAFCSAVKPDVPSASRACWAASFGGGVTPYVRERDCLLMACVRCVEVERGERLV